MEEQYPILRNVLTQDCVQCTKRRSSKFIYKQQGEHDIPHQIAFLGSGNFDVMVVEDVVEGKGCYYIYRCEDPMCLLNNLRAVLMSQWFGEENARAQQEYAALRSARVKNQVGRRANRRNKFRPKQQP